MPFQCSLNGVSTAAAGATASQEADWDRNRLQTVLKTGLSDRGEWAIPAFFRGNRANVHFRDEVSFRIVLCRANKRYLLDVRINMRMI